MLPQLAHAFDLRYECHPSQVIGRIRLTRVHETPNLTGNYSEFVKSRQRRWELIVR
jgi:hypothetical protein